MTFIPCYAVYATSCDSAEHRQFDFWLGHWQVFRTNDQLAGVNRIIQSLDGCVIEEHYKTASGFEGKSINIFDQSRGVWHQTWTDNTGLLLSLEGQFIDAKMVLQGSRITKTGELVTDVITWNKNADGTVRQVWQTTNHLGETQLIFDGLYKRENSE